MEELKGEWRSLRAMPLLDPGMHLSRFLPIPGTPVSFVFQGSDKEAAVYVGTRGCHEIASWAKPNR